MKTWAVWKKEVRIAFVSPVAYFLFTAFLFIAGKMLVVLVGYVARNAMSPFAPTNLSMMDTIFRPLYRNLVVLLLFLTPAVTMRAFSEEKRMGTIEVLFTYPLTDLQILAGKFLASLTVLLFILLPTLLYPVFMQHFAPVEWPVLLVEYLGLFLMGSACLAVGIWASNMTENQVVAYVLSFAVLLFFWIIGWGSEGASSSTVTTLLSQLSILNHFDTFARGVVNSNDLVYYILFIVLFLYLAWKALESRSWRGARE